MWHIAGIVSSERGSCLHQFSAAAAWCSCNMGRRLDLDDVQLNLFEGPGNRCLLRRYVCLPLQPSLQLESSDEIEANSNTGSADQQFLGLPTAQLCTPCVIALLQNIQSTSYSNYDDSYVQEWVAVQSKCNTGPLPTAVQPPVTNVTALPGVVTSNPSNSTCLG